MPFEPNSLPVSGGVIITAALYAGLSFFVTGTVIGERSITK